jgi:ArsR family transcriptional regulator
VGELCACKILEAFHFTQPTLSYHMKALTESGLVKSRREGSWVHYSLNKAALENLAGLLSDLTKGDGTGWGGRRL